MKKTIFTLLLLLTVNVFANTDKYRLMITDNPATTIMIGWNQISGKNGKVYYGTSDKKQEWKSYSKYASANRSVRYKGMNNTFVKLTGLKPNTNYYFVIVDENSVSERFWFKTAPSNNQKMSFIAGGDSRNNRTPRRKANLLVSKLKPTAVFFGGDMTSGDSNREWQRWFDDWQYTTADDGRMFPVIPARGNHEGSNKSIYNLFNVPSSNVYYKITFGRNLYSIYTLNSEISAGGNQYSWLKRNLSYDNSVWKSAQYHKPMRPHVRAKSEGNDEYSNWAKLFYNKGVKLVFESDSHNVKTTWPVKPCSGGANCDEGFIRDNNGTTYVGEGCWGAPLRRSNDHKEWTRNNGSFNQFKWIFVSESKMEVRTIAVDNAERVGEVSNSDPFQTPYRLDVWNPSNGSVVKITKNTSNGGSSTNYKEVNIEITFDRYSDETSWKIKNSYGKTVMSGSNYSKKAGESIIETKKLPEGCYTFTIYDSYGDGICCENGQGSYEVHDGYYVLSEGARFEGSESTEFCLNSNNRRVTLSRTSNKKHVELSSDIKIYPNPIHDYIFIKGFKGKQYTVKLYNVAGKKVFETTSNKKSINISKFSRGIYIIEIYNESLQKMLSKTIILK